MLPEAELRWRLEPEDAPGGPPPARTKGPATPARWPTAGDAAGALSTWGTWAGALGRSQPHTVRPEAEPGTKSTCLSARRAPEGCRSEAALSAGWSAFRPCAHLALALFGPCSPPLSSAVELQGLTCTKKRTKTRMPHQLCRLYRSA